MMFVPNFRLSLVGCLTSSLICEARCSDERLANCWRLRRLNNAVGVGQVSNLSKHSTSTTIPFLRELNRARHRFWLNMIASYEMLNSNLDKHHRVFFRTYPCDLHLIAGHLLTFLAENGDDIHPSTASQANE